MWNISFQKHLLPKIRQKTWNFLKKYFMFKSNFTSYLHQTEKKLAFRKKMSYFQFLCSNSLFLTAPCMNQGIKNYDHILAVSFDMYCPAIDFHFVCLGGKAIGSPCRANSHVIFKSFILNYCIEIFWILSTKYVLLKYFLCPGQSRTSSG